MDAGSGGIKSDGRSTGRSAIKTKYAFCVYFLPGDR